VNGVLLKPLPFAQPDRLVRIEQVENVNGTPVPGVVSAVNLDDWRAQRRVLADMGGYFFREGMSGTDLTGEGEPQRVDAAFITPGFWTTLGVRPQIGRVPRDDEMVRGSNDRLVVLSHDYWQRQFGGAPSVVGKRITLDDKSYEIVGVMPRDFSFPTPRVEMFIPYSTIPDDAIPRKRPVRILQVVGRMKPGVTVSDVVREISSISDDFALRRHDVFPDAKPGGSRFIGMTLGERVAGDLQRPLLVLFAAVGLVLLIACANIANLAFVRATSRQQEIAVRCCLGAGPKRIAAQLLIENVLLSLLGSIAGLVAALFGMHLLRQLPPDRFPRLTEVSIDPTVLAFTAGIAVVTGLVCGTVPALRVRGLDLSDAIKAGVRGLRSTATRRWSDAFVVVQFALSLVLLVGAGLLIRSYRHLSNVDLGYRPENVFVGRISLPYPKYDTSTVVRAFYNSLIDRVRAIPGVSEVGIASTVPLTGGNPQNNVIAEGHEPKPGEPVKVANVRIVSAGYFRAMGTPLLEGRGFLATDDEQAPRVAVVDEAFARHFWPRESAIGKRFSYGGDTSATRWMTVVGVVRNVKHNRLDEDTDLQMYEPFSRAVTWSNYLVVRSTVEPDAVLPRIRADMKALDPTLPMYDIHTMGQAVRASLSIRRLTNTLLGAFALAALLLAAMGIYGVISISVNSRIREFGIRMALGAQTTDVRALVLRQGILLAGLGVVLGLATATYLTRFLQRLLFGVAPLDWLTFVTVAAVLTVTALVASYLPARRATRADPVLALKTE